MMSITASPQSHLYLYPFPLFLHPLSSNSQHYLTQLITPSSFIIIFLTWYFVHHSLLIFFLPIWLLLLILLCWIFFISPSWNTITSLTHRLPHPSQWPSTHSICWWIPDLYLQNEVLLWISILCSKTSNGPFHLSRPKTEPLTLRLPLAKHVHLLEVPITAIIAIKHLR